MVYIYNNCFIVLDYAFYHLYHFQVSFVCLIFFLIIDYISLLLCVPADM